MIINTSEASEFVDRFFIMAAKRQLTMDRINGLDNKSGRSKPRCPKMIGEMSSGPKERKLYGDLNPLYEQRLEWRTERS